jgi:hypothetical protein
MQNKEMNKTSYSKSFKFNYQHYLLEKLKNEKNQKEELEYGSWNDYTYFIQ